MKIPLLASAAVCFLCVSVSLAAGPAPQDSPGKADALAASGKYREAIALYQSALAAPPKGFTAGDIHGRIADAQFKLADYGSALASYRKAVRDQRPADRPQTQYWIGFCSFLTGKDAEAVDEFLKVPALYPDAKAWGSTSYYWAGRASERMGKKEQAAEYYRKAGGNGKSTQAKFAQKKAEAVNGK